MRLSRLKVLFNSLFLLLVASLAFVQIVCSGVYSRLSSENVIRLVPIDGPRGRMFDRKERVLVTNRISFDVDVVYQELGSIEDLASVLERVLGMPGREVARRLNKAKETPFAPVAVAEDIDKEKAILLGEMALDIRGLLIDTKPKRDYVYGATAASVFGYLSEIDEARLEALRGYGYRAKDLIGKGGLEEYYNDYLMGSDGGMQVKVDNLGTQVEVLGLREPLGGKDLYLTLDIDLQQAAEEAMAGNRGAVIVMDPASGEVLALASHPSFDPNIFVRPRSAAIRLSILRDRSYPLVNRAISGLYPPGSVFKVVTASAGLETGKLSNGTQFECGGAYSLGGLSFSCWKEKGHGLQELKDGIKNSCNVYFYQAGRRVGVDDIEAFARRFGFGRPSDIDLPAEAAGLVPGRLWKRIYRRSAWYEGETVNYSIGQGYLLVTPIQVLRMVSVIANGGNLVQPYIVRRIGDIDVAGPRVSSIGLSNKTIRIVKEAMSKVVNDEDGTGRLSRVEGLSIAGKTGTAQNPQGETHAWFCGFSPAERPRVSLVVFLEHGGKGGADAARTAGRIFGEARRLGYL